MVLDEKLTNVFVSHNVYHIVWIIALAPKTLGAAPFMFVRVNLNFLYMFVWRVSHTQELGLCF